MIEFIVPAIALFAGICCAVYGISTALVGLLNPDARVSVTIPLSSFALTIAFFLIRFGVN